MYNFPARFSKSWCFLTLFHHKWQGQMATLPREFLWQNKLRRSTGGLGWEVFWGLCCTAVHLDKSIPRCFAEWLCLQKGLAGQAGQSNSPAWHLPGLGNATDPGFSLQGLHHLLWGALVNLWKKKQTHTHTSKYRFSLFPTRTPVP